MKSKTEKRQQAVEWLKVSRWEDSKAFRKGTKTREQWEAWKASEIERLEAMR